MPERVTPFRGPSRTDTQAAMIAEPKTPSHVRHKGTGWPLALNFLRNGMKSWPLGMYFCSTGGTLSSRTVARQ